MRQRKDVCRNAQRGALDPRHARLPNLTLRYRAGSAVVHLTTTPRLVPSHPSPRVKSYHGVLAWIPMEEERPNENASALPENPGIFALSAPWSLCDSKSYRGVSHEVSLSIIYSSFVDQWSFRPGKIGIRRS